MCVILVQDCWKKMCLVSWTGSWLWCASCTKSVKPSSGIIWVSTFTRAPKCSTRVATRHLTYSVQKRTHGTTLSRRRRSWTCLVMPGWRKTRRRRTLRRKRSLSITWVMQKLFLSCSCRSSSRLECCILIVKMLTSSLTIILPRLIS